MDDGAHAALEVRIGGLHDNGHIDILVASVQRDAVGAGAFAVLRHDVLVALHHVYHDSAFPQKNAYSGDLHRDRYTVNATTTRTRSTRPTAA